MAFVVPSQVVDLGVVESLEVTFVEPVILGVVLMGAVLLIVVVVGTGVAPIVGNSRVVTLSRLVGLGAIVDIVGGDAVVDVVVVLKSAGCTETSSLPVTRCIASVVVFRMIGLRVVAATSCGVAAETVVSLIPPTGGWVTSFRVVVGSISTLNKSVVVLAVVVVTEVAAGFNVRGQRGTAVVAEVGTSS